MGIAVIPWGVGINTDTRVDTDPQMVQFSHEPTTG